MKGTIAIRLNGRASKTQLSEWQHCIEGIFKPHKVDPGERGEHLLQYYRCDFNSLDQIRALVLGVGGVIVHTANDGTDSSLSGDYGKCILEVPDTGETERLEAPPGTFQTSYSILPKSLEYLARPHDEHTRIVLVPNHNGSDPDVTLAKFVFEPQSDKEEPPMPTTLDEAVDTLIGLMSPESRKRFAEIPRESLLGQTHFSMGIGIRNGWGLWNRNSPLMRQFPGKEADDVSSIIIEATWEKLQQTDSD